MLLRQDNAPAYVPENYTDVLAAVNYGCNSAKVIAQPANSPDFNFIDLGCFCAIQSLQHECTPSSIEELFGAMKNAYLEYGPKKIDDTFVSLQNVRRLLSKHT